MTAEDDYRGDAHAIARVLLHSIGQEDPFLLSKIRWSAGTGATATGAWSSNPTDLWIVEILQQERWNRQHIADRLIQLAETIRAYETE